MLLDSSYDTKTNDEVLLSVKDDSSVEIGKLEDLSRTPTGEFLGLHIFKSSTFLDFIASFCHNEIESWSYLNYEPLLNNFLSDLSSPFLTFDICGSNWININYQTTLIMLVLLFFHPCWNLRLVPLVCIEQYPILGLILQRPFSILSYLSMNLRLSHMNHF